MKVSKNIVITGAFGFVGTNLSKSLKFVSKSFTLIAVDIVEPELHDYDEFVTWDRLHDINWENVYTIIHLAGKAHDTQNVVDEKEYMDINFGLAKKIFDYFMESEVSKFIFFSSVKAVADEVKEEKLDENKIPSPKTPYGKSKLWAEEFLLRQSLPENKTLYILRPAMIHGPGNKGNLNLLYEFVQTGFPWPLGRFDNKRSFTSIDNLNYVINRLLNEEIGGGIYHMADDDCLSIKSIIKLIAVSSGKKARILKVNKKLVLLLAKFGDKVHLPLNTERLKKLTESYMVSNSKLKRALKIEKMPVTAEEGLQKTLFSFRSIQVDQK